MTRTIYQPVYVRNRKIGLPGKVLNQYDLFERLGIVIKEKKK